MLRHAHSYIKGGNRTFAALRTKDCNAGQTGLMHLRLSLTQHPFAFVAKPTLRLGSRRQSSRSTVLILMNCKATTRCGLIISFR
ncbi:MAG: hypothetical protein ACJASZ_002392 [Yoonia sp.]|jgi:hypothetical protein